MEALGVFLVFLIVIPAAWFLFATLFLTVGAAIARIEPRSFWKALGATLICFVVGVLVNGMLMMVPVIGFLLAHAVSVLIVRGIYSTTFGKALIAYLVQFFFTLISVTGVFFIMMMLLGLTLGEVMDEFQPK